MKTIKCADLGAPCDFVAEGTTDEEVKKVLKEHGDQAHADLLSNLTDDDKKLIEQKIATILAEQA